MDDATRVSFPAPPLEVTPLDIERIVSLRLLPRVADTFSALSQRLDIPLDGRANTIAMGHAEVLRIGLGEWLLLRGVDAATLKTALHDVVAQVCDLTSGIVAWRIAGARAVDLLNAGCSLDLAPEVFPPGSCARTALAHCSVILLRRGATSFDLIIDRPHAHFMQTWLDDAQLTL